MKTEKGVIAVVYKESGLSNRYLVLHRIKNWEGWELLKGHLEDGNYEETVRIELEEEAGISPGDIEDIEEMGEEVSWEYERDGEERSKQYRAYRVKVGSDVTADVSDNPHDEHDQAFFLGFKDARTLLHYDDNVELLEEAESRTG